MILYKAPGTKEKFSEIEQVEILVHLEIPYLMFFLFLSDKERLLQINLN